MNRKEFEKIIREKIFLFDGATGTMLQNKPFEKDLPPEMININHPDWLQEIAKLYIDAGCEAIETNTFGASSIKLKEHGLEDDAYKINFEGIRALKEIANGKALIAASIGPTGKLMYPIGELKFDDAVETFKNQIKACTDAGADIIIIETMAEPSELKAAVIAAKEVTEKPIIATMTFQTNLRTLVGVTPEVAAVIVDALDVSALGANCSLGPDGMVEIAKRMSLISKTPLIFQPNAGLPELIDGKTVFPASPSDMAEGAKKLVSAGANIIGGCCGTTPSHLIEMKKAVKNLKPINKKEKKGLIVSGRTSFHCIGEGHPFTVIGERINPTRRRILSEKILSGDFSLVREDALKQVKAGASILDINMGIPGADEAELVSRAVYEVQSVTDVPIMIDSSNPDAIEAGLKAFSGKPIINSVSGEEVKLTTILPLAKKYGAAILALAVNEEGVPEKAEEKFEIIKEIVKRAEAEGIRKDDIIADCVVSTVAAQPECALETLRAVEMVKKDLQIPTILGVSNVSHGLPSRNSVNSTFLIMAIAKGLDAAIINPLDLRIQEALKTTSLLTGRDKGAVQYINFVKSTNLELTQGIGKEEKKSATSSTVKKEAATLQEKIEKAVIEGDKDSIIPLVEEALASGMDSLDISNQYLIPALEKVGEAFRDNTMFLPQVLMSAEVIEKAFKRIKQDMKKTADSTGKKILMATVEGDVHDIGKNIVTTLLQNHGFNVIDIGKNVPCEKILEEAKKNNVDMIGLSALMTTTVMQMEKVINALREKNLNIPVAVGGAVVTQTFADKIGASLYAKDALEAVKKVKDFFKIE